MRKTPYQHLMEEFREFASKVVYARQRSMWTWKKDDMSILYQRVVAAQQIGYEVVLRANTEKEELAVRYVEKRPDDLPWRVK